MLATIFDLDGCLADDRHRRHLIPTNGHQATWEDWEAYHALCHLDKSHHHKVVAEAEQKVFVTGRSSTQFEATTEWLMKHYKVKAPVLVMRPPGTTDPAPKLKIDLLTQANFKPHDFKVAYDDREDVLNAYRAWGIRDARRLVVPEINRRSSINADKILEDAARTFRERNAVYGNNWNQVPEVIKVLFPDGVPPELVTQPQWHLFELMIVKLTRFANTGMTHKDSIHDTVVYGAMIEDLI